LRFCFAFFGLDEPFEILQQRRKRVLLLRYLVLGENGAIGLAHVVRLDVNRIASRLLVTNEERVFH
jgi:hypothetical protein